MYPSTYMRRHVVHSKLDRPPHHYLFLNISNYLDIFTSYLYIITLTINNIFNDQSIQCILKISQTMTNSFDCYNRGAPPSSLSISNNRHADDVLDVFGGKRRRCQKSKKSFPSYPSHVNRASGYNLINRQR